MWTYFSNKSFFITGGTGFLGTSLIWRLVSQVDDVKRIYVLCRGGKPYAAERWRRHLPEDMAAKLIACPAIEILEGNILQPCLGLSEEALGAIEAEVEIMIHAASSINLVQPLEKIGDNIIGTTERITAVALRCQNLERFVYVSTAFVNAHLYPKSDPGDLMIKEDMYRLPSSSSSTSAKACWQEIQMRGSSEELEGSDFPWAYAYAKHLSERMITEAFTAAQAQGKLLILRPSAIGPAQSFPYPGFSVPLSTPISMIAAMIVTTPSFVVTLSTKLNNPENETTVDEVPVDVVVDRLFLHLAYQSSGCIHAVSGERSRYRFCDLWRKAMSMRKIPWSPQIVWTSHDWHSPELHLITRLYVVFGTSFNFSEDKTLEIWDRLSAAEKKELQVFKDQNAGFELETRRVEMRRCINVLASRIWLPSPILSLVCP